MLRLSRLSDYAVTLLTLMGKESGRVWAATELGEASGFPLPTVSKILKLLAKHDVVTAQRGAAGGYRLTRAAGAISLVDVIEAVDGPIALTDCAEGSAHEACNIERICPMSGGWNKVNQAVRQALAGMTLAEIGAGPATAFLGDAQ